MICVCVCARVVRVGGVKRKKVKIEQERNEGGRTASTRSWRYICVLYMYLDGRVYVCVIGFLLMV